MANRPTADAGRFRAVPERSPAFAHLSLDGLRAYRRALTTEEGRVSYWRRIIQARLDVVRAAEGFYAIQAVCTHLGCLTAWNTELGIIACPCHGSKFNREGVKIAGPAPRPLPWLRMWLSDDGDLMVDRSTLLARKEYVRV